MKWIVLFNIGKFIDTLTLGVVVIASIMALIGWIIDATWIGNAFKVIGIALVYSLIWFIVTLIFFKKIKELKEKLTLEGIDNSIMRAKENFRKTNGLQNGQ
jgi:hypothetical protein